MKIKVVDFIELTNHYTNYIQGLEEINNRKEEIIKELEPIKSEINEIFNKGQQGEMTTELESRFEELRQIALEKNGVFNEEIKGLNESLNVRIYDELVNIINEWALSSDIDMIFNNMEILFNKEEFNVTNEILEVLKNKNLFV